MNLFRGWFGEKKATFFMWLSLNGKVYRKFHNIIIPGKNGSAQIDHLLISPYGIFIVETKNTSGWIFGDEDNPKWTSVLYRNKYTFQNPLRQTYRQKMVLSEFLRIDPSLIHTVVYFVGDCKFKTPMPDNVRRYGIGSYIRSFQKPILSESWVNGLCERLREGVSRNNVSYHHHVMALHHRHASTTNCPKCGASLVERTVKRGPRVGTKFLGCSNYPKCKFNKNL